MSTAPFINFPARFAFVNPDDGTLTMEALRLLRTWFDRLGGSTGVSVADVDLLAQFQTQSDVSQSTNDFTQQADPSFAELKKEVAELRDHLFWTNAQNWQGQMDELQLLSSLVPARATPGGLTTQVQFNDAGAFAGDVDFTWNKTTNVLTLGVLATPASITSPAGAAGAAGADIGVNSGAGNGAADGGGLNIVAGSGGATGGGGNSLLRGGDGGATSGAGGNVGIGGGDGITAGAGGGVGIYGGAASAGAYAGGPVTIQGGASGDASGSGASMLAGGSLSGNNAGGPATVSGGAGHGSGAGGDVLLVAGVAGATGRKGNVVLNGANVALATNATGGFTTIPTCAGAPTGVPAGILTGNVAMVYDSTNDKLYIYRGGWKTTTVFA